MNYMEIILCVPGNWNDKIEIIKLIVDSTSKEYLFTGNTIIYLPSNTVFQIDVCMADERMKNSFFYAGQGRLSEQELNDIDQHNLVVYIIGKGGNPDNALKIMRIAQIFLNIGGLGVKVETCGKAFNKTQWNNILLEDIPIILYEVFVIFLYTNKNEVYTCGMHNIGMRDIICNTVLSMETTIDLMKTFIFYQLIDKPIINANEIFRQEYNSQPYRISIEDCYIYNSEDLFYNPFGLYRLIKV